MCWNNSRHYGFCVKTRFLSPTSIITWRTPGWLEPLRGIEFPLRAEGPEVLFVYFIVVLFLLCLLCFRRIYVLVIAEITTDLFVNEADFAGWPTMFSCFTILHLRSPVGWHARYINICNTGSWEHVKVSDVCPKSIGQCEQVAPVVFDYLPCQFTSQSAARVLHSPVKITPENSRLSCNVVLSTFTLHLVNLLPAQLLTVLHDYWLRDLNTLRFLQE